MYGVVVAQTCGIIASLGGKHDYIIKVLCRGSSPASHDWAWRVQILGNIVIDRVNDCALRKRVWIERATCWQGIDA